MSEEKFNVSQRI